MKVASSKYLENIMMVIITSLVCLINLFNPNILDLSIHGKYLIVIISIISTVIGIFFYRFIFLLSLQIFGIENIKSRQLLDNLLLSTFLFNILQYYIYNFLSINSNKTLLRIINPSGFITIALLYYFLTKIENAKKNKAKCLIITLIIINLFSQFILGKLGV